MHSTHTLPLPPRAGPRKVLVEPPVAHALVLGRYRLLERLGAGGFGVVWRAHDELLDREVAVKRIALPPDGDSERASREALASARLAHPAIVALYEACAVQDAFYLISELVRGQTLRELISSRALSDALVLEIGIALSSALAHAHARGVIHRDVKPQNILIPHAASRRAREPGPAPAVAKLTDFGGARLAGEDVMTRTGDVLGTLAYMAPEQSEQGEVGEAADLYSLALVLYEAFCGVNPVRGPTPAATVRRIGARVEPLERRRGELPRRLTRALDKALCPTPAERGTLEELQTALGRALEQTRPLLPLADTHARERRRPPRRAQQQQPRAAPPRSTRGEEQLAPEPPPAQRRRELAVPRKVWVALATAAILWQAAVGHPGAALLLLAALLPLAAMPKRTGPWWLASALAPALGLVRLAGAYPVFAGQAVRWQMRATLGALGYWWLTLSEPLLSRHLWLGPPAGTPPRAVWEGSLHSAAAHVVGPTLSLGVLLGAALWAAGATCLPWIVRGRRAALDVVAVTIWSAAIAAAAPILDRGLSAAAAHASPRGAVLGAVFGGVFAVAVRALRGPV